MFHRVLNNIRKEWGLTIIILGFIILAGTGLFYNFGLGTAVSDEAPSLSAALKMIADHTPRPAYPTFYYLPVAAYAVLPFVFLGVLALPLFGVAANVDAIREFVILNFAQLLPWVRLASLFYSVLAIYALYLIARRLFERRESALLAAFFLSTSFLFVQLAHFDRVWGTMLLVILFALWASLRLLEESSLRQYLIAAMTVALSFGFNMIGILTYVPFVVVHALKHRGESFIRKFFMHRDFLLAHILLFVSIFVFYYLNPYGFENYVAFIKKFFATTAVSEGAARTLSWWNVDACGSGQFASIIYYPRIFVEYELPLLFFSLLGFIPLWRQQGGERRKEVIVLGSFSVAYLAGITLLSTFGMINCEPRYALPMVPGMALLGALGIAAFLSGKEKYLRIGVILFVGAAMLYGPIMFDLQLALPATRLSAREWIQTHVPSGARMVMFDEALDLPENQATLRDIQTYAPSFMTKKREYLLNTSLTHYYDPNYYVLTPAYFRSGIPVEITAKQYDYLVVSWWDPKGRAVQLAQIKKLALPGTMERVARFPNGATDETESLDLPNNMRDPLLKLPALTQNGPVVDVYRLH